MHNGIVDTILDESRLIWEVKETLDIRLIVGEEHGRDTCSIIFCAFPRQYIAPDAGVLSENHARFAIISTLGSERGFDKSRLFLEMPNPVIAVPERWQQV